MRSALIGQRGDGLKPFIELSGEALTSNSQDLESVFMHPQLSIGNLHATDKLLELIGERIEVIALALKSQNRIVGCRVSHYSAPGLRGTGGKIVEGIRTFADLE